MARDVLLFGNGLGRSICDSDYRLDNALQSVLKTHSSSFQYLRSVYNRASLSGEDDLEVLCLLQDIIALSEDSQYDISDLVSGSIEVLNDDLRKLQTLVANHYFELKHTLPASFREALRSAVNRNCVIATLNYDGLIYLALLGDSRESITDGFLHGDFTPRLFDDLSGKRSTYLHLHGSALFRGELDSPCKLTRSYYETDKDYVNNHIVLTPHHRKQKVIESSAVLRTCWQQFERQVNEADRLVIIGWSGRDMHLCQLIANAKRSRGSKLSITIFEPCAMYPDWNDDDDKDMIEAMRWFEWGNLGIDADVSIVESLVADKHVLSAIGNGP